MLGQPIKQLTVQLCCHLSKPSYTLDELHGAIVEYISKHEQYSHWSKDWDSIQMEAHDKGGADNGPYLEVRILLKEPYNEFVNRKLAQRQELIVATMEG